MVHVDGIDVVGIERAVDAGTFERGLGYARRGRVLGMEFDGTAQVLRAQVRGSGGAVYDTEVCLERRRAGLAYAYGECTCPIEIDCKHAVAVALVAAGVSAGPSAGSVGGRAWSEAGWEEALGALLEPESPSALIPRDTVALAVELSLEPARMAAPRGAPAAPPRLLARLVRPGRSGWVGGNLSWGRLEQHYYLGEYDEAQVRLLREFYALYRSGAGSPDHFYVVREDKSIDLAEVGGRLWPLLDEAAQLGLPIVHARKALGAVEKYGRAELTLDVTAGEAPGSLVVAPVLRLTGPDGPGEQVHPVRFLGAAGHGVVHVAPAQRDHDPATWAFGLARLAAPAPVALRRMAIEQRRVRVPAEQLARFRDEFFPRLRRLGSVGSSDGSFVPPAITGPTLVLHTTYGTGHDLGLSWEWAYQVGDSAKRYPAAGHDDDGVRDPAAEQAVLDALEVPLHRYGRSAGPGIVSGGALTGMATMRFTTEVLPLLVDASDVVVESVGEPAEYREAGDSLQIAVSTADVAGDTDWFDLGVSISLEGRAVPFAQVFTALAADESHLLLPDGAYFSLHKPELQSLRALIEEARALQDTPAGPLRISRYQAGLWEELAALGVVDRQARDWERQVAGLLALDGLGTAEPPATLRAQLRPYQRVGYDWLCFLQRHGLGGILADDMGLGKTVQALALICRARLDEPDRDPFLIVAPTSVVANWAAEAARFAPDLAVATVTDTLRRRGQELSDAIAGAHVVVTSYTLFRLEIDAYAAAGWSGLILDEAQFVKNHQSKAYQCARRLPAPFKLAITGTPMENNVMELWSLLSITAPGLFPSPARFREHYAKPIEKGADAELLPRLRRRIRPLVVRRTKEQVAADLPPKQQQVLEVELDPRHRRTYQRHLQRERQKVLGLLDDVDRNRFTILRSLTLLRQLSLHPGLVEPESRQLGSAKITALVEQLGEVVDGGHRALVFSQFTGFLGLVRERLDAAGVAYCYLDGSTRDRPAVLRRFTEGTAPVFLISLKAGGFGLNLTEADYCFLLDPWWNPATEAQAIDRTHRIGQTRTVMVYRMIAKDTIEEKVLALAQRKAALFTGVMDEGGFFGGSLTADDVRALLE
ncbi:MAG: DEAD/DEAH box helicase [Pseudonocardia sp.]|nr:DEAD/DEAH box helicase [Pseudonocardia sp.]